MELFMLYGYILYEMKMYKGLDVRLLPIRLRRMHEDLEHDIQEYRQLAKDKMYEEGVQCLSNALHSSPPKSASLDALEPLIQVNFLEIFSFMFFVLIFS